MPKKVTRTRRKEAGKRYALNMRATFEVRQALERAAAQSGRSLAQEVEHRLERSFHEQELLPETLELAFGGHLAGLLFTIGSCVAPLGPVWAIQHTGYRATDGDTLRGLGDAFRQVAANWPDDPYAYDQLIIAANKILEELRPPGDRTMPEDRREAAGKLSGRQVADGALAGLKDPPAEPAEPHDRWRIHARHMLGHRVIDRIRVPDVGSAKK
jgi:hypothetical protein